jgi:hypothetical protein
MHQFVMSKTTLLTRGRIGELAATDGDGGSLAADEADAGFLLGELTGVSEDMMIERR